MGSSFKTLDRSSLGLLCLGLACGFAFPSQAQRLGNLSSDALFSALGYSPASTPISGGIGAGTSGFNEQLSYATEFLNSGQLSRDDLALLAQQSSGLVDPHEMAQLESFLASTPGSDAGAGVIPALGDAGGSGSGGRDSSKFEPLPSEPQRIEPLFLSGRKESTTLPRFGSAEGRLNTNFRPLLFAPYVQRDGQFNYDAADFVLRPLYLDLHSVEVATLYTDNVGLDSTNERDDVTVALSFNFSAVVEIRESFRLAAGATLVYLPTSNEFGFSSLGGNGLRGGVVTQVEAVYDVPLGGWDLMAANQFSVRNYTFSGGRDSGFSVFSRREGDGTSILDRSLVDVDGHNVNVSQVGLGQLQSQRNNRFEPDGTEFRNQVSGRLSRLLPRDLRLGFRAAHSDSWFSGFSQGLPTQVDQLGISLVSERENTRFKPALQHGYVRRSLRPGWDRITSVAFSGPLTDYINVTGRVGSFSPAGISKESFLWGVDLGHQPHPAIHHAFYVQRGAVGPNIDLSQDIGWRLNLTLGSTTDADFLVERGEFIDLDGDGSGSEQFRTGFLVRQDLGNGLVGSLGIIYRELDFASVGLGANQIWTWRVRFDKRLSDSLSLGITYQLEQWESSIVGGDFLENLVIISASKQL